MTAAEIRGSDASAATAATVLRCQRCVFVLEFEKKIKNTITALQHLEMFCSRCDGLKRKLTATLLLLVVFEIRRRGREEASPSRISTSESFEVEFVAAALPLP